MNVNHFWMGRSSCVHKVTMEWWSSGHESPLKTESAKLLTLRFRKFKTAYWRFKFALLQMKPPATQPASFNVLPETEALPL